jgi:hypothetical protein
MRRFSTQTLLFLLGANGAEDVVPAPARSGAAQVFDQREGLFRFFTPSSRPSFFFSS